MATFTETWESLIDILRVKSHHKLTASTRYALTVYAVNQIGEGFEYKVIGEDKVLTSPIKGFKVDSGQSYTQTVDQIWNAI